MRMIFGMRRVPSWVTSSPAATLASTAEVLQIPDVIAAPQRSGSTLRRTRQLSTRPSSIIGLVWRCVRKFAYRERRRVAANFGTATLG